MSLEQAIEDIVKKQLEGHKALDERRIREIVQEELRVLLVTAQRALDYLPEEGRPALPERLAPPLPPAPVPGAAPAAAPARRRRTKEEAAAYRAEREAARAAKGPRPTAKEYIEAPGRLARIQEFLSRSQQEGYRMPRAINIRGTNGSGKSWLVHGLLKAHAANSVPVKDPEDERRILGYVISRPGKRGIFVVGSYETTCGGCDGISGRGALNKIYDIVERQVTEFDRNVLFEGIIVCSDFERTVWLTQNGFPLDVLLLNTPLQKCIDNVNARRGEKGNGPLEDPRNIIAKYEGNERSVERFAQAGVNVRRVTVAEAAEYMETVFG